MMKQAAFRFILVFMSRLQTQLQFILEIDKLKSIFRQTLLIDSDRNENDAEHSWHLAIMAVILAEYAPPGCDITRVIKMVLLHDLVEIDAGDTYCYDAAAVALQHDKELKAADRIFNLLPPDQAAEFRAIWDEFEARQTPESRFAAALDRVQPVLLNYYTQGRAWRSHNVTRAQVIARNSPIEAGAPELWAHIKTLIDDAVEKGYIAP